MNDKRGAVGSIALLRLEAGFATGARESYRRKKAPARENLGLPAPG